MSENEGIKLEFTAKQATILSLALGLLVGGFGGFALGTVSASPAERATVTDNSQNTNSDSGSGDSTSLVSLEGIEFKGEPDLGNESAPIKVVEYTEFGCPFCSEWEGYDASSRIPIDRWNVKKNLVQEYVETGEVEFIQKNWPQPRLHPNSIKGHKIANCVYRNANESKYWDYQGQLFDRRAQWMKGGQDNPKQTFRQISNDLGLDTETILSCYNSSNAEEAKEDQNALTRQIGRIGTPTFFIGNREQGFIKISGAQPLSRFREAIQRFQ
ncbi:thioredoxin domain-containing protein [Candidatus Nanohaloarchaea archaeon]|nr:thioredoxin domain-containing protein [Candidatus Nanohaloarchaea archaeon]